MRTVASGGSTACSSATRSASAAGADELRAHEETLGLGVDKLVISEDIRAVSAQGASDLMNQPALIRTVHEQKLWRLLIGRRPL